MFGITNDTKTEETKYTSESSYGGYAERLRYEQVLRERGWGRAMKAVRLAVMTAVCILFGLVGMLAGFMVYDMVDQNRELYYPLGSMPRAERSEMAAETTAAAADGFSAMSESATLPAAEVVTPELARRYRIPMGVMLRVVEEHSAAAAAGILAGDIIVAVNGVECADIETLEKLLAEAGSTATVTVFRNNKYLQIDVKQE